MKIFVAGASGVIGRRLVPLLVAAGHDVVGLTRASERTSAIEMLGARPVVGDVFDREGLIGLVRTERAGGGRRRAQRHPSRARPGPRG